MPRTVSFKNVGAPNTPQEIKRLRRENMDLCRRMGQPVVFRHLFGLADVKAGVAKKCPACYDDAYDQTRADCAVCYGFGFVSVEDNPDDLYIDTNGNVQATLSPSPGWVKAPRYGGFGVPYLTWIVEPDVAVDVFRISNSGVMVKQFDAQGIAPWFPTVGDNDLCVNVTLAKDGFSIDQTLDRFQLKRVQQITIRGFGVLGRGQAAGQPFLVAQSFEMNKSPENQHLADVPVDATWY